MADLRRIWLASFLVLLTACARSSVQSPDEVEGSDIDWSRPRPGFAVAAESLEEAKSHVAFAMIEPRLGPPKSIFTTPNEEPLEERVVWLVFEEPGVGPFWVIELKAHASFPDNFNEAIANCKAEPEECPGKWSTTTVRGDLPALLIEGPEVTAITWRQGDVEMRVMGPAASFSGQDAVDVANAL